MNIRLIKPDRKVEIGDNISLAVIAHAYKPLGGSSNDFPLKMMSRWFKQVGFFVILYDRKSTSWTGDIEVEEYTSILKEVVSTQLSQYSLSKGYSAGSLIASRVRELDWLDCEVRYLLLSHPLSVSWALNLFRGTQIDNTLHDNLKTHKHLAIWGTNDQFTGVERYRQWSDNLKRGYPNTWSYIEIKGADHFGKSFVDVYNGLIEWITS
ncbi:hypothetical protein E3Q22_03845 [Wallemia mellicola]|uniref:Alpha/beta hydrolase n=1 Tax=Wallemia mellicola TaxID=1708541 RepID=A0A4T0MWH8_9BASI|nr:hypothetical protein E3Q24_03694 [Wallemia mellicola]TIB71619.1 hypothetical protein E3Q23_03729 [Wallemia mellicola]TIB75768.1 hypothetical protein E3Q22_03845 [Wallemia mellicola]TIB80481.1 hypothetical protein E3Q21_03752 [Wallemia mellicola]TIB84500.1 hypothetical protein E3Q20_03666 [Wallemia mellicola]